MNIRFNDVQLQFEHLKDEILQVVSEVGESGQYILGSRVARFEAEFAEYCGASAGVGVASGMDALVLALDALDVRPGDDVLVPAVSAAATAMSVVQLGANPVFVDLDSERFTMSPDHAGACITPKTKAIVPVHLYGMPADVLRLAELGLPIVEDAAQAHGARGIRGRAGSWGVAAAFSFYPTKNLGAYGDGGMVVTSDPRIADHVRRSRNYGQQKNYRSEIKGWNSRLDEVHAAILSLKLRHLDAWNARRSEVAALYRKAFEGLPLQLQSGPDQSSNHLFVVLSDRRDELSAFLAAHDVPTLIHYPEPLHQQPAFVAHWRGPLPEAERLCRSVLSLPIHAWMTDAEVDYVASAVSRFFGRSA